MPVSKRTKRTKSQRKTKRTKHQRKTKTQKSRGGGYMKGNNSIIEILDKIYYLIEGKNIITKVTAKHNNTNFEIDTSKGLITSDKVRDLLLDIPNREAIIHWEIEYYKSNIKNNLTNLNTESIA